MTHIGVKLEDETVWLTIDQMAELFDKSRSTINEHILNIFSEKELVADEVVRKIGNSDFSTKPTNYYNLDVIISVGYRVKSIRGTQFRRWATERLHVHEHKPMYMHDYVEQLDSLLVSGNRQVLTDLGKVSHEKALEKAKLEYRKYQENTISPVEQAYIETIKTADSVAKKMKNI